MSVSSEVTPESTTTKAAAPPANPILLGLPCFVVGAISLGLYLLGYLPAAGLGALVPIVLFVPGLGLLVASIWAAREGQSAVAGILGLFSVFWISYGFLVFGLVSGVLGVTPAAATAAQATFLIAWLVAFIGLTVSTLRLPMAYTVMFVLIVIAVALVLVAVLAASTVALVIAGICALAFGLVGFYMYVGAMMAELGGAGLGLGTPMMH